MEQLLNRTDLLEFPVIFFQNGFILVIKPVSFAAAYRLHGLCIQLAVVYRHVRINGGSHFHAYKTAAAAAVCQRCAGGCCGDVLLYTVPINSWIFGVRGQWCHS